MDEGNAKHPMTPELWAELRAASEDGESDGSLLKRFPVTRNTIKAHRRAEGWAPSKKAVDTAVDRAIKQGDMETIVAATRGNVISMSSRKVLDIVESNGTIDHIAEALKKQAIVSDKLMTSLVTVIDKFNSPAGILPGPTQNLADVLNSLANATKNVFGAIRDVAGLRPGTPSVKSESEEDSKIDGLEFIVTDIPGYPGDSNEKKLAN